MTSSSSNAPTITVALMENNKTPGVNDEACREMNCPELYKQDDNPYSAQQVNRLAPTSASRRPDIDVLNICLTWLILLFHVVLVYTPHIPWYVKDPNNPIEPGPNQVSYYAIAFIIFMNGWNMPLFFFLAGVSSYLSLKRRSEAEYRKERVHRLLVPALFLMVCTNPFYAVQFFAPMSSSCLEHYYHNATNKTADCLTWGGQVKSESFFPTSFGRKLLGRFLHPDDFNYSQAWFCVYLFVYSQIMAFNFSNWHSKNGVDGFNSPMCCGKTNLDILKKPFSRLAKSLCCMCVFFLPSSNPGEFSKAIQTMFLGSFKLMLVPGAFLAFIEILLRWTPSVFASLILDWCNNVHFMFVYFMGYAIMAEDDHGIAKIMKKYRWMYLIIGTVLLQIYVAISLGAEQWFEGFYPHITPYILKCIFRGFGEWTFIIGLYSVNRHMCTRNYAIIRTLREMAMPFYLLHQQVLVVLVSGTLWVSYLGSFPATIILSTICTLIVSFLVVKSPDPVRYFFGLPSKHSIIPGEKLSGFLPLIGLCMLMVIESVVANLILRFA